MRLFGLTAAWIVLVHCSIADAHVSPSVKTNNRYIKMTPLGDRVRLAYTVYFGQIPGQIKRQEIDRNRDRNIDDKEADVFAQRTATSVLESISATANGTELSLAWHEVHIGLGNPSTSEGAFTVDAIAWLCYAEGVNPQRIIFTDRLSLERPGETELRLEAGPGIEVLTSGFKPNDRSTKFAWNGADTPMKRGFQLTMNIDPELATSPSDGACSKTPSAAQANPVTKRRRWLILAVLVPVLLVGVFVLIRVRSRADGKANA